MASLSRKNFIEKASVGAVTVGVMAAVPSYAFARETARESALGTNKAAHAGPILAHVRNAATGEIAVLFGTQEVVIHDRAITDRLLRAAQ